MKQMTDLENINDIRNSGTIKAWAIWGVIWTFVALSAWTSWVLSDTMFKPAIILTDDEMSHARLLGLRALEVISMLVVAQITWVSLIKPWLTSRTFGLDAMLLLSGVIGFSADALLNLHEYLFAFNTYSVNMGVWTSFLPFYTDGPSRVAESLLWGFPMYVYFGIGASFAGCGIVSKLRKKYPNITNASAFAVAYVVFIIADVVLENTIMRLTDAYMYPKTYGPLTMFAGSMYQFPFYEALCSSLVCIGFTIVRQSGIDSDDGLSFVERGASRVSERYRTVVRTFAVIGAAGLFFLVFYHLPFNWLGMIGESVVQMPSYMYPG